jgi:crotonobetainyl-CoA:carnitine CoA-transferase CaiB-like acyl-CoA transferase
MEDWGVGYRDAAAHNERIIYAMGSSFGPEGPEARREGADLSAQAAGGLISTTGVDGKDFSAIGANIADHIAGQNLLAGVLAALYARERTGRGQLVESSLLGGQIWAQAGEITKYLMSGEMAGPGGRSHPMIPGIYGLFPTADGWIAIVGAAGPARQTFFEVIGRPDLIARFPQIFYWDDEKDELWPLLNEAFAARTTDEWCTVLHEAGLRYAPVRDHSQVLADPAMWENGYFATLDGPNGPVAAVLNPVRFSDTPARPAAVAPELGQHTEEILLELGRDWDQITRLRDAGVV